MQLVVIVRLAVDFKNIFFVKVFDENITILDLILETLEFNNIFAAFSKFDNDISTFEFVFGVPCKGDSVSAFICINIRTSLQFSLTAKLDGVVFFCC